MIKPLFRNLAAASLCAVLVACGGKDTEVDTGELPGQEVAATRKIDLLWDGYISGYAVRAGKGFLSCSLPAARPEGDKWEPGTPCVLPENSPVGEPGKATIRSIEELAEVWLGPQHGQRLSVGILPAFVAHARGDRLRFDNDRQILVLVYKKQ